MGLFTIVPRHVVAGADEPAPSEKLRIAGIGSAGQAMHDLGQVTAKGDLLVCVADVDEPRTGPARQRWPEAKFYADWREMFEKEEKNFDAVVIACPDHVHAVAACAAMQLRKHVYVEKPMAHNISEVRHMAKLAKETGVVTQMGNQGHSGAGPYRLKLWLDKNVLGKVTEVHSVTNRPTWLQGVDRPALTPEVPEGLAWDLWLGPAQERPYHPAYCPRAWRGWWDFGTCALGDMGCHVLDAPYYALAAGAPTRISAEAPDATSESGPKKSIITFEFPARGDMPAFTWKWYDGGNLPPRPEELPEKYYWGDHEGGSLLIGDKGKAIMGTYGNNLRLLPDSLMENFELATVSPHKTMGHHREWVEACKTGGKTVSNFEYAAGLTELVHLGNLAIRAGQPIEWDSANMKITNVPEANQYLTRNYRAGWKPAGMA
jgi:predicted dehydrogenase